MSMVDKQVRSFFAQAIGRCSCELSNASTFVGLNLSSETVQDILGKISMNFGIEAIPVSESSTWTQIQDVIEYVSEQI